MFPAMPHSRYLIGSIPWYSALIVTGMLAAIWLASKEEKRLGLKEDTVIDLAFWVIPAGLVGARLYYVVFSWETFADDPLSILYIWRGGLAIYGGIIGGGLAALLFSLRRGLNPFTITDIIVPGLALAQSIGRWGNYFNMEAYGPEITDPAWQFFPFGVLIPEGETHAWHMATFFYESVWNAAVFVMLWFVVRRRSRHTGTVTGWYLLLYGIGRFFIEGLRTDSLMSGSLRVSQVLSIVLALCAAITLIARAVYDRKAKEVG